MAFKGRIVWESLVLARTGLGLVCRWLCGEGERRGRCYVRAKQIPFLVCGWSTLSLQTWLLICGSWHLLALALMGFKSSRSCNHLGSGLSLHLYKHLHPLLLTCGLLYSAAKLVNSCNQIAVLLTACMKVNNTSIFQCPASSLMTLLTVLVGSLSDITSSGTLKTIVSVLTQATWLIWAEQGGCAGRSLPTDCPCASVPCAIVITFHGLMAGWGQLHPAGKLCLTPTAAAACSGFVFGCDWCLRSLF